VLTLEVDGDHCFRVGEQGILVHNASAPTNPPKLPCPATTQYTLGELETVTFQNKDAQRATMVMATIVKDSPKGQIFSGNKTFPAWWESFRLFEPNVGFGLRWQKGHLLDNTFGGPGGSELKNLAALIGTTNSSTLNKCQARIADALDECGCVYYEVKVTYADAPNPLRPTKLTIYAATPSATIFDNIEVLNISNPQPVCDKKK